MWPFDSLDFEIDLRVILVTVVMWGIVALMIWKMTISNPSEYIWEKTTATIVMLPIIFYIVQWQSNK